jgi:hypothetical protein
MTFVEGMWFVWGALVLVTAALYLYRSRLERDEEDQIFLDDSFGQEKAAQEVIVAKVSKIKPIVHIFLGLTAAVTLLVVVYNVWQMLLALHLIGD